MKFIFVKRKEIFAFCLILTLIIALFLGVGANSSAQVFFGSAPRLVPIYNVDTSDKKVAITFDSAWGADKTLKIIEILKQYNANATFFLVGFWAEEYPEMVKALDQAGIEIGTHSNTHPDFTTLSESNMRLELETSINTIKSITNKDIKLFRAPFGAYNNTLLNLTESMGLKTIQWDVDTLDWKGLSGVEICERVMNKVKSGSIILNHNNADHVLESLPLVLERLTNAGYQVVSVGELIHWEDYYIDSLGIQHKN